MKKLLAFAVGLCAIFAFQGFAQQDVDYEKVEIKATRLSDTVWMMEGYGGNLGVSAGADTVFLVDDQFAPLTGKIQAAIAKVSAKPVQFLLNTHLHRDHTGGNENFARAGAVLVAQDNVRRRMSTDQFNEFTKTTRQASPKAALPIVTFASSMSFHVNGEEIRVAHAPRAHTDGDSIVHFTKSDVIHMGDVFFNGLYPFIDAASGGSVDGVIAACDQVMKTMGERTRIIPGHGPVAGRAELQAYRDMLATVSGRVRKAIAEGQSDEQISKAGLTREYDEKWGKGFFTPEQFAGALAAMLRRPG